VNTLTRPRGKRRASIGQRKKTKKGNRRSFNLRQPGPPTTKKRAVVHAWQAGRHRPLENCSRDARPAWPPVAKRKANERRRPRFQSGCKDPSRRGRFTKGTRREVKLLAPKPQKSGRPPTATGRKRKRDTARHRRAAVLQAAVTGHRRLAKRKKSKGPRAVQAQGGFASISSTTTNRNRPAPSPTCNYVRTARSSYIISHGAG